MAERLRLERIRDEAEDWRILISSGAATEMHARALEAWLTGAPEHRAAFAHAVALWNLSAKALREHTIGESVSAPRGRVSPSRVTRRGMMGGLVAASGVIAVRSALHPPFGLWPSVSALRADFRTSTGERRIIGEASAVTVELNTRTSLNIRDDGRGEQRFELISGEASIRTKGDLRSSVLVVAADGALRTRAADLNIRCEGKAVTVACLQGGVEVVYRSEAVQLMQGNKAVYGDGPMTISPIADANSLISWREGRLIFRNTPLRDVIGEINRYRPGKLILLNRALGDRPVRAIVALSDIDEIIGLIVRTYNAKATRLPGNIVVLA